MSQPETFLPLLFIGYTLFLLLLVILFFIHRRNNKKQLSLLRQKIYELPANTIIQQNKQFDIFKQGLQQLLNDLSKRLVSNEQHVSSLINQLEEIQAMLFNTEDEANATETDKNDLTNESES